jgi:hypothetical protein
VHINTATVDEQGQGLVTWLASPRAEGWDGEAWCRSFRPDGSWMAPGKVTFAAGPGLSHSVNPGCGLTPVMLAGSGEGLVVGMADRYRHQDQETGLSGSLLAAAPVRGGEPADPAQPVGPLSPNLDGFKAVGNGRDTLLAAWLDWGWSSRPRLFASRYSIGRGWEPSPAELPVGMGVEHGKEVAAAVTTGGTSLLAWSERSRKSPSSSPTTRILLASAKSGQGWSKPLVMAEGSPDLGLGQVAVAAGPAETAALAWTGVDPGSRAVSIQVAIYRPDRGWSEPRTATQVQGSVRDGTAMVFTGPEQLLLACLVTDKVNANAHELRTVWCTGDRWSGPRTHGQASEQPAFGLASDGNGHALLAWREERRNQGAAMLAAIADAPGAWHGPALLSTGPSGEGSVEHVSIAMGANGTACALWDADRDGTRTGWAALFKPTW